MFTVPGYVVRTLTVAVFGEVTVMSYFALLIPWLTSVALRAAMASGFGVEWPRPARPARQ
jgi:hypothetical protein